uniref:Uncharacterized protein n=1 Tax=Arundo donax TaxID=35708 RepID=A0A0A9AYA7_ARUDO
MTSHLYKLMPQLNEHSKHARTMLHLQHQSFLVHLTELFRVGMRHHCLICSIIISLICSRVTIPLLALITSLYVSTAPIKNHILCISFPLATVKRKVASPLQYIFVHNIFCASPNRIYFFIRLRQYLSCLP